LGHQGGTDRESAKGTRSRRERVKKLRKQNRKRADQDQQKTGFGGGEIFLRRTVFRPLGIVGDFKVLRVGGDGSRQTYSQVVNKSSGRERKNSWGRVFRKVRCVWHQQKIPIVSPVRDLKRNGGDKKCTEESRYLK